MAETLTTFVPQRITLGSSNLATKVTLPRDCKCVTLRFEGADGKYSTTGTDGGAIDSTDYVPVPAGAFIEIDVSRASHGFPASIYLASATGSTVVLVAPEVES